ncbi:MAG: hypothetical protein V3S49_06300, partial [Thermodesulfobacteriota bacterium]
MKITKNLTLKDLGFKKKQGDFPKHERDKIVKAVKIIYFKDYNSYSPRNDFDTALAKELGNSYTDDKQVLKVFRNVKSRIKDGVGFKYAVDLFNPKLRIAIEVEKNEDYYAPFRCNKV